MLGATHRRSVEDATGEGGHVCRATHRLDLRILGRPDKAHVRNRLAADEGRAVSGRLQESNSEAVLAAGLPRQRRSAIQDRWTPSTTLIDSPRSIYGCLGP